MVLHGLVTIFKFLPNFGSPLLDHLLVRAVHLESRKQGSTDNSWVTVIHEFLDVSLDLRQIGWVEDEWKCSERIPSKIAVLMMNVFEERRSDDIDGRLIAHFLHERVH